MTSCCNSTDFMYPMCADVYYAIISQDQYGKISKQWVFDRTIACNAAPAGGAGTEEIDPKVFLQYENKLIARTKDDLRISSREEQYAATNILIANVRDGNQNLIYKETAGPRKGKGTIYEVATFQPFSGPFGNVESFKALWRRTENQSVGD